MKTKLLLFLAVASLAGSCKKNDGKFEFPGQPFIQLQQVEHESGATSFQYNSQHQLTRVEQLEQTEDAAALKPYQYTNFSYSNGLIQKAEYFIKSGSNFYKRKEFKYHLDAQKRIAYVARVFYFQDGSEDRKDTVRYTFDADNKLTRIVFSSENQQVYTYDDRGNYVPESLQEHHDDEVYTYDYEFRYDSKPNPFAVRGLGLYVFSVYHEEPFWLNQLLSTNNPVYSQVTISHKVLDENNQPVYSNEDSYTTEYANSFDTEGILKQADLTNSYQRKENGNIVENYSEQGALKFTCVRKR